MIYKDRIDLNIGESYLSSWDESLAIRELIANAIDESGNKMIKIKPVGRDQWKIINKGAEIQPNNFTMNDMNKDHASEKIGKFGVGLKDAIAVLTIRGIRIEIITSEYRYIPKYSNKCKLINDNILFINVYKNTRSWVGTEIILSGCEKYLIDKAKLYFLVYRDEKRIKEETKYGEIIFEENVDENGTIYFNGMKIDRQGTFLYSYNIIGVEEVKNGLSRERKDISREVYKDGVKKIISEITDEEILNKYFNTIRNSKDGGLFGELVWEVTILRAIEYAINKKYNIVIFSSESKKKLTPLYKDLSSEKDIITITLLDKYYKLIRNSAELKDKNIFAETYVRSYKEVNVEELMDNEKFVFERVKELLNDYIDKSTICEIVISENKSISYRRQESKIIIGRNSLKHVRDCFLEIINIISNTSDNGEEFKEYIFKKLIDTEINRKNN